MPFAVRCYIFGLVVVAVSVVATLPLSRADPYLLLALCVLVVAAERLSRVSIGTSGWTMSVSLVVTLITVLVLAPPAAALVGLVTSLTLPRLQSWTWTKQIINSAMMSLVPASGAGVCHLAGGHAPGHFLNFPEFLWPVAAAVTTCLVANALIIAGYVGLATNIRFVDGLRGDIRRATMPYYSSAVLALIFLSLWKDIGWYTAPLVVVPMYIAHWSLSQYAKEGAAHEGTIAALVQAVEIKDSYTRGHSERVARGAGMLAERLKMPQDRLAMLRFAGLLHDIGKLGVPTRLLTSTGGLTEEEFKLLCMHPNHGVAVLRDIRFLTEVYEGVLYHHERLDGRGYPTGKSGDEIPEFARIIGVADAFDAMTSTRSYRAARSVEEAVAELRRGAGTQFDPDLVRAFEAALEFAERDGQPWVPTELAPAEPQQDDETSAAAVGPWPLPKRVPGFSFADHDDPFVPAEWFPDWYPSSPAPGREPGPGGIPGQRTGELETQPAAEADLDDGWSERMYSAVVREAGPDPDEGRSWDGEQTEAGQGPEAESEAEAENEAEAEAEAEAEPEPEPVPVPEPERELQAEAEPADAPGESEAASTRWPVDPGLHGAPRGSMRVRSTTPAADPDPRGPAAGVDLRKPAGSCQDGEAPADEPSGADDDTVRMPQPKPGDPEAWTPSPEPWSAPEPAAEASKTGEPAGTAEPVEAESRGPGASLGPSWFSRGAGGSSPTLHFFGPADTGPWPPRDPDAKDSEESSA
jgi:xanthosine utilization system XapX-like protein